MAEKVVMAVDVGTGSARAGVFDATGRALGRAMHPIRTNRPAPDHAEHASSDIWLAVGTACGEARSRAGAPPEAVAGLSFDVTCSLVALDRGDHPASVSDSLRGSTTARRSASHSAPATSSTP